MYQAELWNKASVGLRHNTNSVRSVVNVYKCEAAASVSFLGMFTMLS